MRDRAFEILMFAVGLIGLLILFALLFAGPKLIIKSIVTYFSH